VPGLSVNNACDQDINVDYSNYKSSEVQGHCNYSKADGDFNVVDVGIEKSLHFLLMSDNAQCKFMMRR